MEIISVATVKKMLEYIYSKKPLGIQGLDWEASRTFSGVVGWQRLKVSVSPTFCRAARILLNLILECLISSITAMLVQAARTASFIAK